MSVGNLSAGGSGKTPFVLLLGELLKARSIKFDVLSRGYGRSSRGVLLVDPAGLPQQFGDEPLLIARKLRVPVIVGEDRYQAGVFAESRFGPQVHLLDDGFQHRSLARDFDIALVTPQDANDRLLPAGRMRETLRALGRARMPLYWPVEHLPNRSRLTARTSGACAAVSFRKMFRRDQSCSAELRGRRISFCN